MSELESELESELHRALDPVSSYAIPPRRALRPRGPLKALVGGTGAALSLKVLTGVAVAAAAVTVAGAASTGSLNPAVWGQQVKQQVETCKDQLAQGQHGIGECVSDFASQHGQTVASGARQHGNGNGNGGSQDKNKDKDKNTTGNGSGTNKSRNPAPPAVETGEPTDPSSHGTPHGPPGP
jgi:hypothetical protein